MQRIARRFEIPPGSSAMTTTFEVTGPLAEKSALAAFTFEPVNARSAPAPGAPWSPSVGTFYQYLPAAMGASRVSTRSIVPPAGSTAVVIEVQPWQKVVKTLPFEPEGIRLSVSPSGEELAGTTPPPPPAPPSARWTPNPVGYEIDHRMPGLPIHYRATHRPLADTDSLLVLMPAALTPARPDREKLIASRFTWSSAWPNSEVIAVTDPALQESSRLNGAWFIHPKHDIIAAIAGLAADIASARGIPPHRILFYGSSLGGFGAIAAASVIDGARAVAEVPQIHFANWGRAAVTAVEQELLGCSLEEFGQVHPERLSLPDRLLHSGRVPGILLITNPEETRLGEQLEFLRWIRKSDLPRSGPVEMLSTDRVSGHAVLERDDIPALVRP